MVKYLIFLMVCLLSLVTILGCGQPEVPVPPEPEPLPEVMLETPPNGSTVSSLTPILTWTASASGATYRIQVSGDYNFEDLTIDVENLTGLSYRVPSGRLSEDDTYYWRVRASKGSQTADWSSYWSFRTPAPVPVFSTIQVKATLDGSSWTGNVKYTISGPQTKSGSSVTQSFSNMPTGSYTIAYSSGGPSKAILANITPSLTQTTVADGTTTFTMNFITEATSTVLVEATLDGEPWSGAVHYEATGPRGDSDDLFSVPDKYTNLPAGTYAVGYRGGGPAGATLAGITPSPMQTVSPDDAITFTMNFYSQATGKIVVNATRDGLPWTGNVEYTIKGPYEDSSSSVPHTFSNLPTGRYTLVYRSGGPAGYVLNSISPSATQELASDGTMTFTLNFIWQPMSTIEVRASLNGVLWAGYVNYTVYGPQSASGSSVPQSFNVPPGSYTIGLISGGPPGATLASITPSPTQNAVAGKTTYFTLSFYSYAVSTIQVRATLDGAAWSGFVNYIITGPVTMTGSKVTQTFPNIEIGTYNFIYKGGGPGGASLASITPQPVQTTFAGGTTTFTLNFVSQATSSVQVRATLDGEAWSGDVHYEGTGPRGDSDDLFSVPDKYSNLPAGTYTIGYISGGPEEATLASITPSPLQTVSPGGTITFTMNFHSEANGRIEVNATRDGLPWTGNIEYTIKGPYEDSSNSVPDSFGDLPAGSYTLVYRSGGPAGCTFDGISPSVTQELSPNGTITFTLDFVTEASGRIVVNAIKDGAPWTGNVDYVIVTEISEPASPENYSNNYVPNTHTNLPAGSYTLVYRSGGPAGCTLDGVSPSATQELSPDGTITFTLNFYTEAKGQIVVNATLDGQPWTGMINYTISVPLVDPGNPDTFSFSHTVPYTFSQVPEGSYTLAYESGGPDGSILDSISPSATQKLPSNDTITFTLNFVSLTVEPPVIEPPMIIPSAE